MLHEISLSDVLLAPIVGYLVVAGLAIAVIRFVFGQLGLFRLVWHPALVEVALFTIILSLLVLYS